MMAASADRAPSIHAAAQWLRSVRLGIRFAGTSLGQNRMRMALAVIGVAVGIGSVSSMLLIGHSVEASLRASLDSLGADVITLVVTDGGAEQRLPGGGLVWAPRPLAPTQLATAVNLLSGMPEVQSIGTAARLSGCDAADATGGMEVHHIDIGVQPLLALTLEAGRWLTPADDATPNVVLGSDALLKIREIVPGATVGSAVPICGKPMNIIGILKPHRGSDVVQGLRVNASALLSTGALQRLTSARPPVAVLVRLGTQTTSKLAADTMTSRLEGALPGTKVTAAGAWQVSELRRQQVSLYTSFLAVLGGISLLVGSLGIANVMLAAVAERRKEIGLRMAIGATRQDITIQFLVESASICLMGAVLGVLLGIATAGIALMLAGFALNLSISVVLQSTAMAISCGLLAGAYPAHQAALVDPIGSLQGGAS